jgi:hypothetical protein
MKKNNLTEELNRIKNLMVYNNGDYRNPIYEFELLNEAPTDEVKEVSLQANFKSGRWKDTSLPKTEILAELKEAIDWLKQKSKEIKDSGGIIGGQAKILTVQIEAGESQVTNYDAEVDPKVKLEEKVLSERRAKTIQTFLTNYFKKLQKDKTIDAIPVFEAPVVKIGPTPWNPKGGDEATDKKFTKEQYIKVNFKLTPPSACLEGLVIEVMYVKEPNPSFPCRGGHQCDDALFDVYLNETKLDGVANLNNAEDGGSRSSKFVVSPQQALSILGNKPGNIMISFVCKNKDKRCHSSTPEIRLSKGGTVVYHECTPSISETNDYSKIDVMELDACGNLIKKGQEKKTAQKDESLMKPPAGIKKGWVVYDIATKLPVFKDTSASTDLQENIYKKYLPLYGYNFGGYEPEIYKGNCNEAKIYGGWCLWSGIKINYVNDQFCGGAESGSSYKLGSESTVNTNLGKSITNSMRNYMLDNCDSSTMGVELGDIITVKKDDIPKQFNFKRLYSPLGVYSNPKIVGNASTPFKLVPNEKPNGINFTPKLFTDFVNNIYGTEQTTIKTQNLINLITTTTVSDLSDSTNAISFFITTTDETFGSTTFPNSTKIDSYVSKYNTFKNEKLTGSVVVGGFKEIQNTFLSLSVIRKYEKGIFKNNTLRVMLYGNQPYSSVAQKLISLGLIKEKSGKLVLSK